MQFTYLPNGAQDAGRQTSGVLLLQAALGQILPRVPHCITPPQEEKKQW